MNTRTSRSWAIVGVVGKSKSDDPTLLADAKAVGEAIAIDGQAILTGGHHQWREESVKHYALLGAYKEAKNRCVRLIGVLPKNISTRLNPAFEIFKMHTNDNPQDNVRWLYVHTQLENKDRDAITGRVADVLIALAGEKGTSREIAAALIAGRPIVFFKSLLSLRNGVVAELENQNPNVKFSQQPLEATCAKEAVSMALRAIEHGTSSQRLNGCYPSKNAEFEAALRTMEFPPYVPAIRSK